MIKTVEYRGALLDLRYSKTTGKLEGLWSVTVETIEEDASDPLENKFGLLHGPVKAEKRWIPVETEE